MGRRRGHSPAGERLLVALLGLTLALLGIARFNAALTPYLVASARADYLGGVTLRLTETARAGGDLSAAAAAESVGRAEATVPLGSLLGIAPLHGRGPTVRLRVPVAAILHVMPMDGGRRITAELTLFLPWHSETSTVETEIYFP